MPKYFCPIETFKNNKTTDIWGCCPPPLSREKCLMCFSEGHNRMRESKFRTATPSFMFAIDIFASVGPSNRLPNTRVLDKFPRSQNRPSLITPPRLAMAVPSMPVKRWNFHKAKWSHYIALTNKLAKTLLPPDLLDVDAAYQDFCNTIKKATKKTIPRGYRNNYIPC